jgi:dephospho-CoA kinase
MPAPPQRRIGLTGGIATGKSRVGHLLAEHFHLPVLDADRYAREALAPETAATRAVLNRWGGAVATPVGTVEAIDRAALGRIVFAEPEERRWLERLVHPLVRQRFALELENLATEPAVVLMIPLLFEAGLESLCTEVWLVDCSDIEQRRRLMVRDGLRADEAEARLAAQWPQADRRQRADRILPNPDGMDDTGLCEAIRQGLADHPVDPP